MSESATRRPGIALVLMAVTVLLAGAWFGYQALVGEPFEPEVGQEGKDVIWVPTPDGLVAEMLRAAEVEADDLVVDLGSGDGRIAIAAARDFGARARGIEYNPDMVDLSRRMARQAGVGDRVEFIEGDIFAIDFSDADVVTMYLLPSLNQKLMPTLLGLRPGVRIVSHAFLMDPWEPDAQLSAEGARAYLWVVPADASGVWRIAWPGGEGEARLEKTFQMLGGSVTHAGTALTIEPGGRVRGSDVGFAFQDGAGARIEVRGTLEGDQLQAQARVENGPWRAFTARREAQSPPKSE